MRGLRGRGRAVLAWALAAGWLAGCGGSPAEEAAAEAAEAASPPAPSEPRRTRIEVAYGETAGLTLAGGECHVLELEIEADRYIEVEIDQQGLDLYTTLEPPGGGEALFFDSPTGPSGSDAAAFVTEQAGRHRIEICPLDSGALAGSYELALAPPRRPTARARTVAQGFRRYSAGELAVGKGDLEVAAGAFQDALRSFQEAGLQRPRGWAHAQSGLARKRLGDLEAARSDLQESARIHRELSDSRQEAWALSHLGTVLTELLRLEEAREVHRRSVRAAELAGDRELFARSLKNLALLHQNLGETLEAVETHRRRRTLAAATGDLGAEWHALSRIGKVYRIGGDDERAESIFEEALAFARRHGLESGIVESLVDLGRVYVDREEPREALRYFLEALERMDPSGPDLELASVLNNIGRCYRRLGEREKALELFGRALAAVPPSGWEARIREGAILVNVASLHILEGDFEAAEEPSERALSVYRAVGRASHTISALKCLAEVRAAQGRLEEAASYLAELIEIVEGRRSRSALQELRASLLEDKYFYYEAYVRVLLRLHERHPGEGYAARAFELTERAKARLLLDELAGTESDILATADPAVLMRRQALEVQMSDLEERLLRERLREGDRETVRAIQARLSDLEAEHALATARIFADYPGWSALLESEPVTLEAIRREILGDGDTLLVSFLLGDEESFAWIVGRNVLHVEALPPRDRIERLAREAADLLRRSDQPHLETQARLTAEVLSRELLGPVVPHLQARKLLLVKDGALHYVPFAALPWPAAGEARRAGGELLTDRFELVDVPSASAAVALRQRRSAVRTHAEELAILADPVFELGDDRLLGPGALAVPREAGAGPRQRNLARITRGLGLGELARLDGTSEEARRISSLVSPDRRLVALGFDANRDLLLGGRLSRYRILHLAGHGLAHPDLTGLVLSLYDPEGRPVDGLVRPYQVYGTKLAAELVVLSACSTGLGDEVRGEGLLGLSRGFLYAGASRVLASLWDVDDQATAELMERFYLSLLRDGHPPATALREAQRSLRLAPGWAAPHYWAGFVLQGDGR